MHPVPLALAHAQDMAQQSNVCSSKNERAMLVTIANINIFRISIKIIPNIELTKLRYQ